MMRISLSLENDGEKKSGGVVIFLERNHLGKLLNLNDHGTLGEIPLPFTTMTHQTCLDNTLPPPTPLLDLLLSEHLRPDREDEKTLCL